MNRSFYLVLEKIYRIQQNQSIVTYRSKEGMIDPTQSIILVLIPASPNDIFAFHLLKNKY
jgi:hypothetical protein